MRCGRLSVMIRYPARVSTRIGASSMMASSAALSVYGRLVCPTMTGAKGSVARGSEKLAAERG
jgi:hypothetical protein